jgi:hypothetical protein
VAADREPHQREPPQAEGVGEPRDVLDHHLCEPIS